MKILLLLSALCLLPVSAHALCPVCAIAAGTGIGLFRHFGVDDAITGLWLGGFTVSLILWTLDWLDGRKIIWKGRAISVSLTYYLFTAWAVVNKGIVGDPINRLFGMDKLCWGVIFGSLGFFAGGYWYAGIKRRNGGHAQFPFQKVVLVIAPLLVLSGLFYLARFMPYGQHP